MSNLTPLDRKTGAGKGINPQTARGLIMGGMCMGLGLGSREAFSYKENGLVLQAG